MTAVIGQKITQNKDLKQLRQITSGIIGETCWKARLGYGDELRLESGTKITVVLEHLNVVLEEGEWGLGTRATPWQLESSTGEIIVSAECTAALLLEETPSKVGSSELDLEIIEQKVHILEGTTITAFDVNYPDLVLTIKFSNGCQLKLFPNLKEDNGLSYWELFTPENMLLTVDPGIVWSYIPSDEPLN